MMIDATILAEMKISTGESLKSFSENQPTLLVFLRRFGCTFCREALDDLSKIRPEIEERGVQVVFVHMADNDTAETYFERFNLPNAVHISDEACKYYEKFGLLKGNTRQLFGLSVLMRGFQLAVKEGYGFGFLGDGFQMPGIFLIKKGEILNSYIHATAADKPDYFQIACAV